MLDPPCYVIKPRSRELGLELHMRALIFLKINSANHVIKTTPSLLRKGAIEKLFIGLANFKCVEKKLGQEGKNLWRHEPSDYWEVRTSDSRKVWSFRCINLLILGRYGLPILGRYEKILKFHVVILDMSCFEISYPEKFDEQGAANLGSSSSKYEHKLSRTKCKMEKQMEVNTNTTHNAEDEHSTQIKDIYELRALLEDK
ncbi:hypothetical protein EZV62_011323 [Acer yangbiense]|uniref:Uncharacterized protein n=1 Tax=Acer yangbiense TaxID=1000413 RepID=A0A5C7I644_9ROSI|nr:hypothetical protein EZV62_011323 [Acer yangbiense]